MRWLFFPQRSLAPLPPQKDTPLPASQICYAVSLEALPKESHPCSSPALQVVSTQRHLSSAPSDTARIIRFSNAPVSADLRSCWFHQHAGFGFKSSFLLWQSSRKPAPGYLPGKYLCPQHSTAADNTDAACRNLIPPSLGLSL